MGGGGGGEGVIVSPEVLPNYNQDMQLPQVQGRGIAVMHVTTMIYIPRHMLHVLTHVQAFI